MNTQSKNTEKKSIYDLIKNCKSRDERKALLRSLSKEAKEIVNVAEDEITINKILIDWYKDETHKEFNSLWEWRKKGFKVKKGERAFFVWSRKRRGEQEQENGEKEEYSFFSLAYLFSNAQVEPLNK